MKNSTPPSYPPVRRSPIAALRVNAAAFTLIELLVVISIIIILMGLLFPAFKGVQEQAKKVQAKNDLTQMVNAVSAFYTEYGRYPLAGQASGKDDYWVTDTSNADLFHVLRADGSGWDDPNGADNLNPRRVVFLQIPFAKDATNPKSGIAPSGSNRGKYYDPWGNTYRLRIDWDYDNQLQNPYTQGAGAPVLNFGVIAYSIGKDQLSGADSNGGSYKVAGQSGTGDDDVLSWQ